MKSVHKIGIIATTSAATQKSVFRFEWIVNPLATGVACGLALCIKVTFEFTTHTFFLNTKTIMREINNLLSSGKLYRKYLQDHPIDENKYESFCKNYAKCE